ncbi:putative quinol monooxygenase [Acidiphilium sp.]|uniref:putative quinol monooxygenase n=1 Tax=Acidiphilium sp. TaxID=527 RepID=UPI00258F1E24|nr:putative quinol monooxygenase [Acidiphilium sp.]
MSEESGRFLALVGSYRLAPEDAPAFAEIARRCVALTVVKPGCLYFTIAEDVSVPGLFHLSEGWADRAALDAHLSSADFAAVLAEAGRLRVLGRTAFVAEASGRRSLF